MLGGRRSGQNHALEQTHDTVRRCGQSIGRELLNFFVRQQEARAEKVRAFLACRQSCCRPAYPAHRPVDRMRVSAVCDVCDSSPCGTFNDDNLYSAFR